MPIDWRETHVYTLADGKIARVHEYRTWEEAVTAAGLQP